MDMEDVNSYKGSPTSAKSASDLNWDAAEGRWQLPSASRCRRGPGGGGGGGWLMGRSIKKRQVI